MTQKSLSTAHIRVISNCAKGVIHSAEGQPPERRRPPFSRIRTSKKAINCPTVKFYHYRAGVRNEGAAIWDFLRDMGQSHIPPVTLILFWILSLRSNHSINANISTQQEAVYRYRLEEGALSHRSRRSETLSPRGENSLVLPSFKLFCLTLSSVAVNHRENHRAAQVRCSAAAEDLVPHSVSSIIRPLLARSVLPASIISFLSVIPGSEPSPACSPFFPFVSESPLLTIALPSLRLLACLLLLLSSVPFNKPHLSLFFVTAFLHAGLSPTSVRTQKQVYNVQNSSAYLGPVIINLFNSNINSFMARSEDCFHCVDLQAELEEIRTQQAMLDKKQNLLEARIEDHDRRLDEQSRRFFEQDRINTEKYKA